MTDFCKDNYFASSDNAEDEVVIDNHNVPYSDDDS